MSAQVQSSEKGLGPPLIALASAILIWACVPLLLKYFTPLLDAWTMNGMRYLFSALFWLPYVLAHRKEVPTGRNIWRDAAWPAMAGIVGQTFFGLSPYFNNATIINFVSRSDFLFTAILGFMLLPKERPLARSGIFWFGFLAIVLGLLAMYRGGIGTPSTSELGMAILVATSAFWGLYAVLVGRCMQGYSVRLSFGVISLYVTSGLLVIMLVFGHAGNLLKLDWLRWFLLWLSGISGIALGHVFFYRAIKTLGPIVSEGGLLFIPFTTTLMAFPLLHERMGRLQWLGGITLVLGCLFLILAKRRIRGRGIETRVASTTD